VARAKFWLPNASQDLRYQCPQHQREVRWEQNWFYVLGFSRGLELVRITLDVTAVNEEQHDGKIAKMDRDAPVAYCTSGCTM